jgi:hypothetical protein
MSPRLQQYFAKLSELYVQIGNNSADSRGARYPVS